MRIKIIKKESTEPKGHWVVYLRGEEWCTRNTEKEAQAVVNSYDGEGECWYEFQADEAKEPIPHEAEYTGAVNAAFKAANVKNFTIKLDPAPAINDPALFSAILYVFATDNDGGDAPISWGIFVDKGFVARYFLGDDTEEEDGEIEPGDWEWDTQFDFKTPEDLTKLFTDEFKKLDVELPKYEKKTAKREGRSVSYFVLGKDTAELDAEKFVSTLEDAVLKDQSVETTAEPDGAISVDIYGQLSPNEVERILQAASQLGIHISGLAVNIYI